MRRSRYLSACYRVVECVGLGYGTRLRRYKGLRTTPGNSTIFLDLASSSQTFRSSGRGHFVVLDPLRYRTGHAVLDLGSQLLSWNEVRAPNYPAPGTRALVTG